jgi:signal transduction histidine kinase
MLRTLRARLALSHMLPVLILVPLLGLALLYQIERNYLLDDLALELAAQGELIAELTGASWQEPEAARRLLALMHVQTPSRVMIFNGQGRLLSSSLAEDRPNIGAVIDSVLVDRALAGNVYWQITSVESMSSDFLDVFVPIRGGHNQPVGVVRISHLLTDLQTQLLPLRWTILTTLFVGGLFSLLIGWMLARSLSSPLSRLAKAVDAFTLDSPPQLVPEQGPEEIRRLARTYNRMSRRLYELETSRRKLLAGVVHELARPLGSIKAAAQTIERNEDRDLAVDLASGIDDQVDQLQFQLEDLSLLGEIELHALTLDLEPIDLAVLVNQQADEFRSLAIQKDLALHCEIPDNPIYVAGDAKRLRQIVGNLLHNACKYTPAGGEIWLKVVGEDSAPYPRGIIQVSDTGPGIAEDEQEAIFDFFYRSPQHRRIHLGLGIGLALSRWLAEAHGGTLTVHSQTSQGAIFTLSLPREQGAQSGKW